MKIITPPTEGVGQAIAAAHPNSKIIVFNENDWSWAAEIHEIVCPTKIVALELHNESGVVLKSAELGRL